MEQAKSSAAFISCAAALLLLVTSSDLVEPKGNFELNAVPVPDGLFIEVPVDSTKSGAIGAICSPDGVMSEGTTLVQFELTDNNLGQELRESLEDWPKRLPKLLLDDGLVLMKARDASIERTDDPRVGTIYQLLDTATGEVTDITPENLTETTPWYSRGSVPLAWTTQQGLAMFIFVRDTREVRVWQGKNTLAEVQKTPPVLASGEAFIGGRISHVEVTDSGVVLAYDWETGRLQDSPLHAELGAAIADAIGAPQKKPVRIAMAQDIAVFRWGSPTVYVIVDSAGSRLDLAIERDDEPTDIPSLVADESTPFSRWNDLTDEEKVAAARDLLLGYKREEGAVLPPGVISALSYIMIVDDTHVGIGDTVYQRYIVIGPADSK